VRGIQPACGASSLNASEKVTEWPKTRNELKQLLDFAVHIAREAGKILWRHYQGSFVAERKADNSFVTVADREAERHLRKSIDQVFPR